jgi:uncharacterized protein (DUF2267 family)
MEQSGFIESVRGRLALPDPGAARRAIEVTLASLGRALSPDEAAALRATLPPGAAAWLRARPPRNDDPAAFYERVARRSGLPLSRAREQAQAVLGVVAATSDPETLARLQRHLGEAWAGLLDARPAAASPPDAPSRRARPTTDTLAAGRPGSRRPLSEARPDRAHSESVASAEDPHGATKISSARGLAQERRGETLATARGERDEGRTLSTSGRG